MRPKELIKKWLVTFGNKDVEALVSIMQRITKLQMNLLLVKSILK